MRAAIVLAAGASRRFGRPDKLRQRLGGRTLLDHVLAQARRSGALRIIVVTSRLLPVQTAMTMRRARLGAPLAANLAVGLAALRPIEREALIFLADMPFASAPRFRLRSGTNAIRPAVNGLPGHPVLVRVAAARAHLAAGDRGLGDMPGQVLIPGRAGHLVDIDTPADLRRARRSFAAMRRG